jgi:hypothetical protein
MKRLTGRLVPWLRYVLPAFVLLLVVGCGPNESTREQGARQVDPAVAAEAKLLSDPTKATPELIQRVRASVKMRDGLIVVDPLFTPGLSVMSANSPWTVICGAGIKAVFGTSVSGGSDGVDNDVTVWLAYASIPRDDCQVFTPAIGKEIQMIIGGG